MYIVRIVYDKMYELIGFNLNYLHHRSMFNDHNL
jgi:hypothetical protein